MSTAPIRIEIVYAEPQRAIVKTLNLAAGSRIADALRLAALDPDFSGVDLASSPLGIFGKASSAEHTLKDGDRVEIYRPLAVDPKTARRARVQQARKKPSQPR
jgi:putative ubiquitin-RnfH superfamily antitoxin RatB of RatAB toxin-antitoxin module